MYVTLRKKLTGNKTSSLVYFISKASFTTHQSDPTNPEVLKTYKINKIVHTDRSSHGWS